MDTTNIFVAAMPSENSQRELIDKIHAQAQSLKKDPSIQWERPLDLHVTLGYIRGTQFNDISKITHAFSFVEQHPCIDSTVKNAVIYGSALCLQLEPTQTFELLHETIKQALQDLSHGVYLLSEHETFDAHMTIGRVKTRHHRRVQAYDKQTLTQWMQQCFISTHFDIHEVAVLHRHPNDSSNYQTLKSFKLKS